MKSKVFYAEEIYKIVKEYRNEDGIYITLDSIMEWAEQFGDDAQFMLMEVAHLIPKVYYSKDKVIAYLKQVVDFYQNLYSYADWDSFLKDTEFLNLQGGGKSQGILLDLLNNLVFEKTNKHLIDYKTFPKKHFLYIDDILATGGTIGGDICSWLDDEHHVERLLANEITLQIAVICLHTLGWNLQKFRIDKYTGKSVARKIIIGSCLEIQNNLMLNAPVMNAAIPIREFVSKDVMEFYISLNVDTNAHQAFRKIGTPNPETFFTSYEDRIKYENILLDKGLDLIKKSSEHKPNVRPLGIMSPYHKMLGLGTHFVTWRNIPNNCPLVFWWDVPAHNWKPLFKPNKHQ